MFNSIGAGTYAIHLSGITLLTNLGFKKEGVLRERALVNGRYVDTVLFGITKKEWELRNNDLPLVKVIKPYWE
jgi:RimJ/RimL family protein N-acetyltransferase